MTKRFSNRTILLMLLALAAFGRLWCATHPRTPPSTAAMDAGPARE